MALLTSVESVAPPLRYFTFRDFLSETEVASFFDWRHTEQVAKVEQYLDF